MLDKKDSKGYVGTLIHTELYGKKFVHAKRGSHYTVVGVAWDGDRDLWAVVHVLSGTTQMFTRSYENFRGTINLQPRFREIVG